MLSCPALPRAPKGSADLGEESRVQQAQLGQRRAEGGMSGKATAAALRAPRLRHPSVVQPQWGNNSAEGATKHTHGGTGEPHCRGSDIGRPLGANRAKCRAGGAPCTPLRGQSRHGGGAVCAERAAGQHACRGRRQGTATLASSAPLAPPQTNAARAPHAAMARRACTRPPARPHIAAAGSRRWERSATGCAVARAGGGRRRHSLTVSAQPHALPQSAGPSPARSSTDQRHTGEVTHPVAPTAR